MASKLSLRIVVDEDLPTFYEQQLDATANWMAAFTARDPADRVAFEKHWAKIRTDASVTIRTILVEDQVAGYLAAFRRDGEPEVTYWIGKGFWSRGIATEALAQFLRRVTVRPIYARVAGDNVASLRVLQKCGFMVTGHAWSFANARGAEIEEVILALGASSGYPAAGHPAVRDRYEESHVQASKSAAQ